MTYRELFDKLNNELISGAIPDPATDAGLLLRYVTGYDRNRLFLEGNREVPDAEADECLSLLNRRLQHEPLQYITGTQCFMGLDFKCAPGCLIPRFDTEILVEEALKLIYRLTQPVRVLDVCTGSGCIAVSLTVLGGLSGMVACDISDEALMVAGENINNHKADVTLVKSDLFREIKGRFNVIVSNPPYIKSSEIPGLMPEVSVYEPLSALDGGEDGLGFYRRITAEADDYLEEGGFLLYEIGEDQGEAVSQIMRQHKFKEIKVIRDLAGLDRVVVGRKMVI